MQKELKEKSKLTINMYFVGLVCFTIFLGIMSSCSISEIPIDTVGNEALLTGAQNFLANRNQQLIVGTYSESPLITDAVSRGVSPDLCKRIISDNKVLQGRKEILNNLQEQYTNFETNLRIISQEQIGNTIKAVIEETTRFTYAKIYGDEPDFTEFTVDREFIFSQSDAKWIIEDVSLLNSDGLFPINEVVTDEISYSNSVPSDRLVSSSDFSAYDPAAANKGINLTRASYNYTAMVNYAKKYYKNYNPAYRSFSSDCTNFISQAMSAGGWGQVSGWYRSNSVWWYNSSNQSFTWAGAENWYWFATGSGRTYILANIWSLAYADVLQLDFNRDGTINHSMIVTSTSTSGEKYLTYHSTNTLNRSLSSITASYPSAWYYAHRT